MAHYSYVLPLAMLAALFTVQSVRTDEIPIGTFFSMWDDDYTEALTALKYALERQHNDTSSLFHFKLYADNIKTVDAYKLTRIICRQVSQALFFSFEPGRQGVVIISVSAF